MNIPAFENGSPVRKKKLLSFDPLIEEEEIEGVSDSLRSGWLTTGPKVKEFEEEFSEYLGCKEAIAVNSCTSGLHLSLAVNDIGKGDEVITTPFTFVSTVNVIEHQRAKPVLVDIDERTYNIDPAKIEDKISDKTEAILPVHYAGHPCEMDEINDLAEDYDLKVIEDAAHGVGAKYKGKKIGTLNDLTCFSFYATKNLTTAEGGMITLDDPDLSEKLKVLSLHGMDRDAWKRYTEAGSWYYDVKSLGYKYNMTDIQAAIGKHQLAKFEDMQSRRREIAERYDRAFKDMDEIITPHVKKYVEHAWHLYPIQIRDDLLSIGRNKFIEALNAENIGCSVHFIPVHMLSYYKNKYGYESRDYPVSKSVYEREISIPLYPKMTDGDVDDVIEGVNKIVEYYRR
ncbi:MAG: DegT/DnrJ/EryC1/StrS family aminotransferase [Thermoplasmatota archaeon]